MANANSDSLYTKKTLKVIYVSTSHNHGEYSEKVGQSFNLNLGKRGGKYCICHIFLMEQK